MFNNRLAEARKRLGLTQKQFAAKAKIQPSTYSSYENNKKVPPLDIALRIADSLGVSLEWLCGRGNSQVTTYGDVARSIIAIQSTLRQCKGFFTEVDVEKNSDYSGDGYDPDDVVILKTSAKELVNFFDRMLPFYRMSLDNQAAGEMFQAWLKGELEKLDKIEINDLPF
ncbi:MAG: helix-turn-helix transcriptional regulator [Clostridiales bacterium]|nr:helix-turn-helix transcriptional regulator [Clostridiales bacterium]